MGRITEFGRAVRSIVVAPLEVAANFARHAMRAEALTPAGILNVIGLFFVFVLVAGSTASGAWQALVRTWDSTYNAGSTSPILAALVFGLILLFCVIIVGLLTRPRQ